MGVNHYTLNNRRLKVLKGVQLLTASDAGTVDQLLLDRVVVINGYIGPLSIVQEEALCAFV